MKHYYILHTALKPSLALALAPPFFVGCCFSLLLTNQSTNTSMRQEKEKKHPDKCIRGGAHKKTGGTEHTIKGEQRLCLRSFSLSIYTSLLL